MDIQAERLKLNLKDYEIEEIEIYDLLETAKNIILARRFPFSSCFSSELEDRFKDLQIRIAVDLFNKRGAEGEISHSENGVSRTYGAENVSSDLLLEITPKCGVL